MKPSFILCSEKRRQGTLRDRPLDFHCCCGPRELGGVHSNFIADSANMWGRQILQIAVNCCRAKSLGTLKGSASAVGVSSLSRFLRTVWRAKRGGSKWLLGVCVTGGYVAYRAVGGPAVSSCKQEPQRAPSPPEASSPEASPGNDQAFDWQLFFKFIGPDWFILLVAIGVSAMHAGSDRSREISRSVRLHCYNGNVSWEEKA